MDQFCPLPLPMQTQFSKLATAIDLKNWTFVQTRSQNEIFGRGNQNFEGQEIILEKQINGFMHKMHENWVKMTFNWKFFGEQSEILEGHLTPLLPPGNVFAFEQIDSQQFYEN